jgi:hypothetical protein
MSVLGDILPLVAIAALFLGTQAWFRARGHATRHVRLRKEETR